MHDRDFWPSLIRALMTEQGWSEHGICRVARLNRTTFRNYMSGRGMTIQCLETVLLVLRHELDAVRVDGVTPCQ